MQVAEQGLLPAMAIRACNNPDITSSILSREISKAVAEHGAREVERRRRIQAAGALVSVSRGGGDTGEDGERRRKRSRRHSEGAAPAVTPNSDETQIDAGDETFLSSSVRFSAPYLKGGETHFEKKVKKYVTDALDVSPPCPAQDLPEPATKIRSRRTSGNLNTEWRNDKRYAEDTLERLKRATKEATQQFVDLKAGRLKGTTQQKIVDVLNKKYHLIGRDESRERHVLAVRTIQRLVANRQVGVTPKKKGPKPKISRDFLQLIATHLNMEQVGVHGEMSVAQIKALLTAATLDTPHEGKFNTEWAWHEVRRIHADILVPSGLIQAEDIRWQWTTYEKTEDFLRSYKVSAFILCVHFMSQKHMAVSCNSLSQNSIAKGVLLQYGFALDVKEILPNGTVCEITIDRRLRHRNIHYDESELRMGSDIDKSGSRSKTHTNPNLNRTGSRYTRASGHVTGGFSVTGAGELLPPLIIFSSRQHFDLRLI